MAIIENGVYYLFDFLLYYIKYIVVSIVLLIFIKWEIIAGNKCYLALLIIVTLLSILLIIFLNIYYIPFRRKRSADITQEIKQKEKSFFVQTFDVIEKCLPKYRGIGERYRNEHNISNRGIIRWSLVFNDVNRSDGYIEAIRWTSKLVYRCNPTERQRIRGMASEVAKLRKNALNYWTDGYDSHKAAVEAWERAFNTTPVKNYMIAVIASIIAFAYFKRKQIFEYLNLI